MRFSPLGGRKAGRGSARRFPDVPARRGLPVSAMIMADVNAITSQRDNQRRCLTFRILMCAVFKPM
jgi:hypothetical protein